MYETCFRDRGIDQLCVKHVSGIGVVILGLFPLLFFVPLLFLFISLLDCGSFPYPHLFISPLLYYLYTMSSPASSYIQVGLDNLEHPLNRFLSPHAQIRGFDWSLIIVD